MPDPAAPAEAPDVAPARPSRFPSPLGILAGVLVLVWLAAFLIPAGEYLLDAEGAPIPGSFRYVPPPLDFAGRVGDLLLAPVNGLYGMQDPASGMVGPFNQGRLFGSAQVFLFILATGGFMTVVFATGALDRGIHHLAHRFRARRAMLAALLILLFGALGSIKSWSDETLGMYALILPLVVALRYDRLVAVAVITVAPFVGRLGSTINPFVIGIGSDMADISIGDGIGLRLLHLALVMAATVSYVLWYGGRVAADPSRSLCGYGPEDAALAEADAAPPPPLTARDRRIIAVVVFTFALLAFSIVPWGAILGNTGAGAYDYEAIGAPFAWELGWWLPELSAMFFVMAVVVGLVARLGEGETSRAFLRGVMDFTGPAFLIVMAKGVAVVMTNTRTIDTVLYAMEGLIAGASSFVFVLLTFVASLPLAFLVGGGSAGTALVMSSRRSAISPGSTGLWC